MLSRVAKFDLILVGAFVGLLVAAYVADDAASKIIPMTAEQYRAKRIGEAVNHFLRERTECIKRTPEKWCSRDLTFTQIAAMESEIYDKVNFSGPPDPYEERNQLLVLCGIVALILVLRIHGAQGAADHDQSSA